MPNRRLTPAELEDARLLLTMVRAGLRHLAGDDAELLFALRRKVYKELTYDERDKPMVRRRFKAQKRLEQGGRCPVCSQPLPERYCVLDRCDAAAGYTAENTRLICQACDIATQQSRGYAWHAGPAAAPDRDRKASPAGGSGRSAAGWLRVV